MGRTLVKHKNGKVEVRENNGPKDQVPLHKLNVEARRIDREAAERLAKASEVAKAAIDAAFRPTEGMRVRVRKPVR